MIRQLFSNKDQEHFHLRGKEPGRLENFSDAVFALAITLLLISTSPPTNFEQIKRFTLELIPFIMCIALIILIWYEHYQFFSRYGLRNGRVVLLNTLFLVIVLFYVYPLKFLTKLSLFGVAILFDLDWLAESLRGMIRGEDVSDLMIIYGIGAASIFLVLTLMYRYAYKSADALQLSSFERFETRMSIRTNLLMAGVPLISVLVAFILKPHWSGGMISGFCYFLYSPVMYIHGSRVDRSRKKLLAELNTQDANQEIISRED